MDRELILNAKQLNKRRQRKKLWQRAVSILGCIVVFCTTYALILPAITQEREAFCGLEEHTHGENCYSQVTQKQLICTPESLGLHAHSPECYNAEGLLSCGQADFVVHTHNEACYDSTGALVCLLPEREAHIHSEECYILQGGHSHGEECYKVTRGSLVCRETEDPGHTHGQSCYTAGEKLLCTQEENHLHGEACYAPGALQCIWKENHVHGEGCTGNVLKCTHPQDESHTHEAASYETQIICENPENHTHGADCYEKLTVCTIPEGHTHGASCYEQVLQCQTPETPGHTHGDECYEQLRELICTLEEAPGQKLLACTQPEAQVHVHGDACFQTVEAPLTCTVEAGEDHTHGAMCYGTWELVCTLKEHTHSLICYSNPEADVETAEDWEKTLADIKLTGRWAEDVLAIAESQLGYKESTSNYIVEEGDVLKGYTRYGAWYGIPYGDWCAMYASFCLQYAGVEDIPAEASVSRWIAFLSEEEYDLYKPAGAYVPQPGDLVFFDWEQDGDPDHVGFVAELLEATQTEPLKIKTIEGNSGNTVRHVTYEMSDPDILGFATLPWQPSAQEQAQIDAVIAQIDALPSADEIEAQLLAFEEAENDEAYENYFNTVGLQGQRAYQAYLALDEESQKSVTNIDTLMDTSWLWSRVTLAATATVPVHQVNSHTIDGAGSNIGYTTLLRGKSPDDFGINFGFRWWTLIVVEENDNGELYVAQIFKTEEEKDYFGPTSANGFTLLIWQSDIPEYNLDVSVGDLVSVSFDYSQTGARIPSGSTATSYGTVTFSPRTSNGTSTIQGASTSEFVKLNIYDYYGAASAGAAGKSNINTNWIDDDKYPGYQWNGGAYMLSSAFSIARVDNIDFGNSMITDFTYGSAGNSITNGVSSNYQKVGRQGGDINEIVKDPTENWANLPTGISNNVAVLWPTLKDGYPALADGTSLNYLFKDSTYAEKKNTDSIDGLFQQDPVSGEYWFDSRDNHAHYSDDTFTLYEQIITPNFILYPFGNFLPFDDITDPYKVTHVTDIDRVSGSNDKTASGYMQMIRSRLEEGGMDATEDQLYNMLGRYQNALSAANQANWKAENAINYYFSNSTEFGTAFKNSGLDFASTPELQELLSKLYTVDFDVAKNFFFGMDMQMNFMQPKGGMTGNDTNQDGEADYPMIFYFAGDDDVWVYMDDVLFLDLTGIHRHVGGEIDFVNGIVKYYGMESYIDGAVTEEPYFTMTFAEVLKKNGGVAEADLGKYLKYENGKYTTFKDYTTHSFNFYYMERGSGSSVCRINFNFPLLRQNAITIEKALTADSDVAALGNPSYPFQILAANANGTKTDALFITAGTPYTLYDVDGSVIQEVKLNRNPDGSIASTYVVDASGKILEDSKILKTDANGVLWLKAGQRAEFVGINENAGKYYVRELLDEVTLPQFGQITVSGSSTTKVENVTVGGVSFTGADSPVTDMSAGATLFRFTNKITTAKLSSLSISKNLTEYGAGRDPISYDIEVTLDGVLLPAGTEYTVGGQARTVETAGIVTISQTETAVISKILAGSLFTVKETSGSAEGYVVTYLYEGGDSVSIQDGKVVGKLKTDADVKVSIHNSEKGATVTIPGTKALSSYDGGEHSYTLRLTQVTDSTGKTPVAEVPEFTKTVTLTEAPEEFIFELKYVMVDMRELPKVLYYRITEDESQNTLRNDTVYVAEVTVEKDGNDDLAASVTGLWKGTLGENGPEGLEKCGTVSGDFVNTLSGSLTVSKTVNGPATDTDRAFSFTVTLAPGASNTDSLAGEVVFPAEKLNADGISEETQVTFTDGTVTVSLKHGESLTIRDIPYGAEWTVTETDADDFAVTTTVTSGDTVIPGEGISTGGTIPVGNVTAAYRNTTVYKLPETGGAGTTLYTMAGLALMGSALCLKYIPSKRRKGGKSS